MHCMYIEDCGPIERDAFDDRRDDNGKENDMGSMAIVRSVSGERFTQFVETGKHQFYADEPETFGGSDRGPGPYEYLLTALGA